MVKVGQKQSAQEGGISRQGVKSLDQNPTTAGVGAGENTWFDDRRRRNQEAQAEELLNQAEADASDGGNSIGEGASALDAAERGNNSLYDGDNDSGDNESNSLYSGAGDSLAKMSPIGRMGMVLSAVGGGRRRKGPLITLLLILAIGGGAVLGTQSVQPFAMAGRMKNELNSQEVSMNQRTDPLMRFMLQKERRKMVNLTLIFDGDNFQPTEKQKNQLKKQGIEIVDGDGNERMFEITDSDGKKQRYTFQQMKETVQLRNKYITAAAAYRGGTAGWWTKSAANSLKRLGMSRDRYKDFKASEEDGTRKQKYKETAKKYASDAKDNGGGVEKKVEVLDEDGNSFEQIEVDKTTSEEQVKNRKDKTSTKSALIKRANKVASGFGAANALCAGYAIFETIHTLVAAQQMLETLNLATGFLEAVDKVKAGDGAGSPVFDYMEQLNQPYDEKDDEGNLTGVTTSAMEAGGMAALFGVATANVASQKSVMALNSEATLMSEVKIFGANLVQTADAWNKCAYIQIGGAVTNAIVTLVSAATGGVVGFFLKDLLVGVLQLTAVAAVGALISPLVGAAANMLAASYIDDVLGKNMGEALVSGTHRYMGQVHQGSGGTPASAEYVEKFQKGSVKMLAEKAEYERSVLSPFDTSSENTFFGSIAHTLVAMGVASGGQNKLASLVSGISRVVGRSAQMLTPVASAIDRTSLMLQKGDCPVSELVGAYSDIYCNPYEITDLDTIEEDPLNVYLKIRDDKHGRECVRWDENNSCVKYMNYPTNFKYDKKDADGDGWYDTKTDSAGNPVINPNSKMGNFAIACNTRTVPLGLASSEVAALVSGETNAVLGSIPVVGDIATAANAVSNIENVGWINGAYCVASEANGLWEDKGGQVGLKWYQRYLEDQNWMEAAGLIGQSSTVALLDEYYTANPLDNSYEGILARFSGLDKETVGDTLALIDYMEWLAQYNPSELGPTKAPAVEEVGIIEQMFTAVGKVVEVVGVVYERVVYGMPRVGVRIG